MIQAKGIEAMSRERINHYIEEADRIAGYGAFSSEGCDLSLGHWWAAYIRQSLEEQAENSRVPDYLRTCAQEAKKLGVVVPQEYILYDAVTGEHLERPNMIRLRRLMAERRIAGVIFPALDRLSREPLHQQIFELEATHYGVQLHYADVPSGNDPGSQFARSILTHAAKLVKLANRKNARGGNIGRVVKGWVPAARAAYGYRYCREAEIASDGKAHIKRAWWEVDELGPGGMALCESPAWIVSQIFIWVGAEGRSLYWVAEKLNDVGIKAPEGGKWSPARVANIVHHRCYTGNHAYNVNARVPNPDRPLGDITAEVKRTLLRPKPEEERVNFRVPPLVSEELWQKANANTAERGRGRGKQGKSIQALLRNRIFCPKCERPMVVRRDGRQNQIYYHCSKYFRPWADNPCNYRKFAPGTWDDLIWSDICTWLRDDSWVEQQLSQVGNKLAKLYVALETGKIDIDDLAPRLKELRAQQRELQERRDELVGKMNNETTQLIDLKAVEEYVSDLKGLLGSASFWERKAFLRSFIKRVEFNPPQVAIDYTIPLALEDGLTSSKEVLRINKNGSPSHSIDRTPDMIFKAVFAFA